MTWHRTWGEHLYRGFEMVAPAALEADKAAVAAQRRHAIKCCAPQGREQNKRLFRSANIAQQRNNVGFVFHKGKSEGGRAAAAGRQVKKSQAGEE